MSTVNPTTVILCDQLLEAHQRVIKTATPDLQAYGAYDALLRVVADMADASQEQLHAAVLKAEGDYQGNFYLYGYVQCGMIFNDTKAQA